jgi:hypothetical protein
MAMSNRPATFHAADDEHCAFVSTSPLKLRQSPFRTGKAPGPIVTPVVFPVGCGCGAASSAGTISIVALVPGVTATLVFLPSSVMLTVPLTLRTEICSSVSTA